MVPPTVANKIHGIPKMEIPALPTQLGAPMSSIITTHSGSNTPIITYNATPTSTAPSNGLMRNKSMAKRSVVRSSAGVSSMSSRAINATITTRITAMIKNGAAKPNLPTVSAEMIGPSAKPPTSIATPRPRLVPIFSWSLTMTMRLMAGIAMPAPIPINTRPKMKPVIDEPYAITIAPTTLPATPQVSSRRA